MLRSSLGSYLGESEPIEECPPPYDPNPNEQNLQASSSTSLQPRRPRQPPGQYIQWLNPFALLSRPFPTSFNLYRSSLFHRVLLLGEHQTEPRYAVSQHSSWSGQPASDTLPVLAAAQHSSVDRTSSILLPPTPGSVLQFSHEVMRCKHKFPHTTFRFTVEVGVDPTRWVRETFEWRHSSGPLVFALEVGSEG
ncbi:hypothetical protein F4778DRAFT_751204 [Xylariomycetidae sp. FL2044]|nr:hypothetical protein F4778DRAFT_751204 [Xylariomycetidae sp. FL2044]